MRIKSLEISGFKSFVDRTVIHFDDDVVGVVGPNGCGKSNIVDAIRWCMGEQSAKHLRGRAMEDVIFNGSESRGPHGFAEVTLNFQNTDKAYAETLPEEYRDYEDIAITRRLFRDGTSEYLLNKTQVRLRDITDLFLGTGVGTKAYSIVEQGRIGQIVTARPHDRRAFIEEAAGVTKFKQRKRLTERKLDMTRQNLLRLNDIVSEMERNRNSLKRQAAKAERFVRYRDELDELFLHDASHRYLEMIVTERVKRDLFAQASDDASQARGRLSTEESALDAARGEAQQIEKRSEQAALLASQTENEIRAQAQEINHSRERLGHLQDRIAAAEAERAQIIERLGALRGELEELDRKAQELGSDESAREADAAAEDKALDALSDEEARASETVEQVRGEVADAKTQTATAEARLDALVERIADTRLRRDRLLGEREALVGEIANLAARKHALETNMAELAEGKRLTVAEREALEAELDQLRKRLLESESAVDAAKNDLGLKRNRLRALEDLHRRLEGVGAGTRALLSSSNDAVIGMVADRVEAPEQLTAALAGLLGDRLQCVIVSDARRGLELLEQLRERERGRATILPWLEEYSPAGPKVPEGKDGVVCHLADMLHYSKDDEPLIRSMIGNAVVVKSASDATAIAERHAGVTAVALDGTVARPDGSISGGSGDDVASAMVEQKREMHALADEVSRLDEQVATLVADHTTIRARMTEVGTALDRAREGAHEGELAQVTVEKDLHRSESEARSAQTRLANLETELATLDEGLETAVRDESESRSELDALRRQAEHAEQTLARSEERAQSWKERVAAQASVVTERKVRLAQIREQAEAARESSAQKRTTIEELSDRSQRLDEELLEASTAYGQTAARWINARDAKAAAEVEAEKAKREDDEAHALLAQVREALQAKEGQIRGVRDELEKTDEDVRRHEMSLREIEINREHLLEGVFEKYRTDLRRVIGDYHARPPPDEEHRRRISELTQLIRRMGPVNLDARREFEEIEVRFQEHTKQKTDIEEAVANLERAIRMMNRDARRMFREAFESVNSLFKETFKQLFKGGRAELLLTDPDDPLESGVDIIAQPPGKKLGNIELMSGGEKALTATAMIFAIFRHRPSPFCVLDEVDAPLDDANVGRYVDMIRAMTEQSQFILITHVKATMSAVDILYGVTMGEPGVSRIVSVKVHDVEKELGLQPQAGARRPPARRSQARDDESEADERVA